MMPIRAKIREIFQMLLSNKKPSSLRIVGGIVRLHVFPRLESAVWFPASGTGCMFSRPALAPFACFALLGPVFWCCCWLVIYWHLLVKKRYIWYPDLIREKLHTVEACKVLLFPRKKFVFPSLRSETNRQIWKFQPIPDLPHPKH